MDFSFCSHFTDEEREAKTQGDLLGSLSFRGGHRGLEHLPTLHTAFSQREAKGDVLATAVEFGGIVGFVQRGL